MRLTYKVPEEYSALYGTYVLSEVLRAPTKGETLPIAWFDPWMDCLTIAHAGDGHLRRDPPRGRKQVHMVRTEDPI